MIKGYRLGKEMVGSGRDLKKVLFWNVPGGTEENYEKPQSI
jgi:hypothetical protein